MGVALYFKQQDITTSATTGMRIKDYYRVCII